MEPGEADALVALLQPLLRAYELLFLAARQFHPPRFAGLMAQIGTPDDDLRSAREGARDALAALGDAGQALDAASDAALQAFAGLREALAESGDVRAIYRAFRFVPIGLEALYPLAGVLPPVNRFFLDPALRSDAALAERFMRPPSHDRVGIMRFAADHTPESDCERGGVWYLLPTGNFSR